MRGDLGARLRRAGRITADQEARARAMGVGLRVLRALVRDGVSDADVATFLDEEGFGPLLEPSDLARAEDGARKMLGVEAMKTYLAIPVRLTPAGVMIAMADPSDTQAVDELRRVTGAEVLPVVGKLTDLERFLGLTETKSSPRPEAPSDSHAPIALVRVRPMQKSTDDDLVVPLTRAKISPPPPSVSRTMRPGMEAPLRPEGEARAARRASAPEGEPTSTYAIPEELAASPVRTIPAPPPSMPPALTFEAESFEEETIPERSEPPKGASASAFAERVARAASQPEPASNPADRWGNLTGELTPPTRSSSVPPGEIGGVLAAIRVAEDRDRVIELAVDAAHSVGQCAVFFGLRRGTLEARYGKGGATSETAIRNVWIPVSSPSAFRNVVELGEPYEGPHGSTEPDKVFRSAVGSSGGTLLLAPVLVGGKCAGVLAVDGLLYRARGRARVVRLADAASEALSRLIRTQKNRP